MDNVLVEALLVQFHPSHKILGRAEVGPQIYNINVLGSNTIVFRFQIIVHIVYHCIGLSLTANIIAFQTDAVVITMIFMQHGLSNT